MIEVAKNENALDTGEHCWEDHQGSGDGGGARDQGGIFATFCIFFLVLSKKLFEKTTSSKTIDKLHISDGDHAPSTNLSGK